MTLPLPIDEERLGEIERLLAEAPLGTPLSAFNSTREPGRRYIGNQWTAFYRTEIGTGGPALDALIVAAVNSLPALIASARQAQGMREALSEVVGLLADAKTRCNAIAAVRRAVGPVATQAQTAAHGLARAQEIIDAALSQQKAES